MEKQKAYRKLIAWQKANELVYQIYVETRHFPRDEAFGVTSQLRRAAVSSAANIVEGSGRQGKRELKQFCNIALGSIAETEYLLELSCRLGYLSQERYLVLDGLRREAGSLVWGLYNSL